MRSAVKRGNGWRTLARIDGKSRPDESLAQGPGEDRAVPAEQRTDATIQDAWGRCESSLRRFLGRFLYRPEDIDDLAQETFLRAFSAVKFRELAHPRAYLFQVARSVALKELSRKSRQLTEYIEEATDTEMSDNVQLEQEIVADRKVQQYCNAIANLPPQCRKVFLMRKVHGLSHKEICRAMGLSRSAVEKHLALGVKRVAGWMEDNE